MNRYVRIENGYECLFDILVDALDQAQYGKGKKRHANGEQFDRQPIMNDTKMLGLAFPVGQARKKLLEACRCSEEEKERSIEDLLGAIVYTSAAILALRTHQPPVPPLGDIRPDDINSPPGCLSDVVHHHV